MPSHDAVPPDPVRTEQAQDPSELREGYQGVAARSPTNNARWAGASQTADGAWYLPGHQLP